MLLKDNDGDWGVVIAGWRRAEQKFVMKFVSLRHPEAEGVLVTLPRNNVNYAYEFTINDFWQANRQNDCYMHPR